MAPVFCLIERRIGAGEEVLRHSTVLGKEGKADGGADGKRRTARQVVRRSEHLGEAGKHRVEFGGILDQGEGQGEFVPAEAGQDVSLPQGAAQPCGEFGEHLVPGGMAEPVVDALEIVEVEEPERHAIPAAMRLGERLAETFLPGAAVEEAGKRIETGEGGDHLPLAQPGKPLGGVIDDARHDLRLLGAELHAGLEEQHQDAEGLFSARPDDRPAHQPAHLAKRRLGPGGLGGAAAGGCVDHEGTAGEPDLGRKLQRLIGRRLIGRRVGESGDGCGERPGRGEAGETALARGEHIDAHAGHFLGQRLGQGGEGLLLAFGAQELLGHPAACPAQRLDPCLMAGKRQTVEIGGDALGKPPRERGRQRLKRLFRGKSGREDHPFPFLGVGRGGHHRRDPEAPGAGEEGGEFRPSREIRILVMEPRAAPLAQHGADHAPSFEPVRISGKGKAADEIPRRPRRGEIFEPAHPARAPANENHRRVKERHEPLRHLGERCRRWERASHQTQRLVERGRDQGVLPGGFLGRAAGRDVVEQDEAKPGKPDRALGKRGGRGNDPKWRSCPSLEAKGHGGRTIGGKRGLQRRPLFVGDVEEPRGRFARERRRLEAGGSEHGVIEAAEAQARIDHQSRGGQNGESGDEFRWRPCLDLGHSPPMSSAGPFSAGSVLRQAIRPGAASTLARKGKGFLNSAQGEG